MVMAAMAGGSYAVSISTGLNCLCSVLHERQSIHLYFYQMFTTKETMIDFAPKSFFPIQDQTEASFCFNFHL